MNWRATAGRPYGLCKIFNIVSTANHYISTIRRDRARPCPKQISYEIKPTDSRIFSLPCVKGAGLLWRPLHLMQKHRPNRQVRRWVGVRELKVSVKLTNYLVQRREGLTPFVRVMICGCMNIHFGFACF